MPHYKLYYFDIRGLGEPIRLLLNYVGQPYEEERLNLEEWPQHKSSVLEHVLYYFSDLLGFPYGKLSVFEVDRKILAESVPIMRYLAKQHGLTGKDDFEDAKVDEFASFHRDVLSDITPYMRAVVGTAPGDKEALRRDLFLPTLEKYLPLYVGALNSSASGFIAASGLTWVDFLICENLRTLANIEQGLLGKYPELEQYIQRVLELPQLKGYISTRKDTVV